MHILIITPKALPEISGNSIDVDRIRKGLEKKGHHITITTPDQAEQQERPDIIHAFHAYKSRIVKRLAEHWNIPYILTLTGTDFNHHIHAPEKKEDTLATIHAAKTVTFLSKANEELVISQIPDIQTATIIQGEPDLPETDFDLRKEIGATDQDILFVLIAGIRQVKDNLFPIDTLAELKEQVPELRYVMVGPILDSEIGEKVKDICRANDFCSYAGEFPHEKMKGILRESDIILNCSFSEGRSNVIFEAMAMGKVVLASDIPSNAAMITDGETGLLYKQDDKKSFRLKALQALDPGTMIKVRKGAKRWYESTVNKKEAEQYEKVYLQAIQEP